MIWRLAGLFIAVVAGIQPVELPAQHAGPVVPDTPGVAIALFDGQSLAGWGKRDGSPHPGWVVEDGALARKAGGGDLYFARPFRDFELHFQWRIERGGNSGLKYRVQHFEGHGWLGCEYQILDDSTAGDANKAAGLYDVFDPPAHRPLVLPGVWNFSRIVVCGAHVEHWLNGVQTVRTTVGSPQWRVAVAESKFADVPGFGENREGRIFLQDHGNPVWFRNIVLIPLACDGETDCVRRCRGDYRPVLVFPDCRRHRQVRLVRPF